MFSELLEKTESLEKAFYAEPEALTDAEAVIRVEVANVLARLRVLFGALAADEELRNAKPEVQP